VLSDARIRLLSQSDRTVVMNQYNRQPEQNKDRSLGGGHTVFEDISSCPFQPLHVVRNASRYIARGVWGQPPQEQGTYVCII
jgi:hypothetical protein